MMSNAKHGLLCGSLLLLGCLGLFGCSAGNGSAASAAQPAPEAAAAPKAEVNNQSAVQKELDATAKQLVSRASRTVVPSKSKPTVTKSGSSYIASYIDIDPSKVHATMRLGSSAATPYTGIVEYAENHMRCTGATRAEALSDKAMCQTVKTRHMKELIRYDGKSWQY